MTSKQSTPVKPRTGTTARSRTRTSTPRTPTPSDDRRLTQVARHVVYPAGITTTGWTPVEAKCREFGDRFDRWQSDLGKLILGKRSDGIYAATVGGVTLSIPRQVAKTFLVLRIVFALCVLFPGLKVLWTAHHMATLSNTFRSASGYARRPKVAPHVGNPETGGSGIRRGSGKEAILFKNGSSIMFGAREQGFGRGFDIVDVEVFDEAQILTLKALEDMTAATNQSLHPHGALLFYMGTPPRPTDPGEVFTERRKEALGGESEDAVYVECSADPDAKLDDHAQWRKANPSFPLRTPLRSMQRLRKNLPSDDSWKREALGIWDEVLDAANAPYPVDKFAAAVDDSRVPADGVSVAWSVDVSWDRRSAHVSKAARAADGTALARVVFTDVPTSQVVELLAAEVPKGPALGVAIQGGTAPVASLAEALTVALDGHCEVVEMSGADCARACGMAFDALSAGVVKRASDGALDEANRQAVKRSLGSDGWAIDRKRSKTDVANLVSWTGALWLLLTQPEPGEPGVWFL